MYVIGNTALYLGILISIYSLFANILGIRNKNNRWLESARGGVLSLVLLSSAASFLLLYILGTSQFQYKYVAAYTSENLPMVYKLTAFWAGNAGSLLLWLLLLCLYAGFLVFSKEKKNPMMPYAASILLLNILFFFLVILMSANPFEMSETIPSDGKGLNPMLQHPGMILHPVTLYLGYVGLAVPFAFAIAALMLKRVDAEWIKLTRRWTLVAWLFLTLGNIIGGWWAYLELGWGGYWAWDPVENASFLPWLTVSAFLHSVMIQERKGMLKTWNISLVILSYVLTLFGTFLVRSGILTSVHAFGDGNLGTYFLIFMAFMALLSIYVVMTRYQLIRKETNPIESYFSKESSFLLNNLILVAGAFAVFWGSMYPLISEVITGTKVNVGPPYFNKVMAPIMLGLIVLMAICPLIAWQKATVEKFLKNLIWPLTAGVVTAIVLIAVGVKGIFPIIGLASAVFMFATHIKEFVSGIKARMKATKENAAKASLRLLLKNQRRYGGYIVHIGIAVIAIGVISSTAYPKDVLQTVETGESFKIGQYELTFKGLTEHTENGNGIVAATLDVNHKGERVGEIKPEKIFYETWPEPSSEVAIKTNLTEDLYVVLSSWENRDKVTLQAKVNPFVSWIWTGGMIMVIGTGISLIGGRTSQAYKLKPGTLKAGV